MIYYGTKCKSIGKIFDIYYNGNKNFMTPHVYGYTKKHLYGQHYLLFEKSYGTGILDTQLYGCTVLLFVKEYGVVKQIKLSKLFKSEDELETYIDSITVPMALDANVYGETKSVKEMI